MLPTVVPAALRTEGSYRRGRSFRVGEGMKTEETKLMGVEELQRD